MCCFLILFLLQARPLRSHRTVRYTDHNGLASTLVGGGIQDSNGLLWFATWNGLNCYDGYDFHWVRIQPGDRASIGTNHIRDILLSSEGNILCHTDDDIYEFNLTTYSFNDIPQARKEMLRDSVGRRWRGLTDMQGNRWTADISGLYKTFLPHHPASLLAGMAGEQPRSLLVDRYGLLWVGNRMHSGINVYGHDAVLLRSMPLPTVPFTT